MANCANMCQRFKWTSLMNEKDGRFRLAERCSRRLHERNELWKTSWLAPPHVFAMFSPCFRRGVTNLCLQLSGTGLERVVAVPCGSNSIGHRPTFQGAFEHSVWVRNCPEPRRGPEGRFAFRILSDPFGSHVVEVSAINVPLMDAGELGFSTELDTYCYCSVWSDWMGQAIAAEMVERIEAGAQIWAKLETSWDFFCLSSHNHGFYDTTPDVVLRLQTTKLFPTLLGRCLPGSRCFKAGQILLICSAEGLPSVSCTMPAAKWMCNASRIVKVFLSGDAGHSTRNHSMKPSRTGAQKVWNHGKPGLRYGHPRFLSILISRSWAAGCCHSKSVRICSPRQGQASAPNLGDSAGLASHDLHGVLFGWLMCGRFVEFGVNFGKACKGYQDILRCNTGWRFDGRHLGEDAEL